MSSKLRNWLLGISALVVLVGLGSALYFGGKLDAIGIISPKSTATSANSTATSLAATVTAIDANTTYCGYKTTDAELSYMLDSAFLNATEDVLGGVDAGLLNEQVPTATPEAFINRFIPKARAADNGLGGLGDLFGSGGKYIPTQTQLDDIYKEALDNLKASLLHDNQNDKCIISIVIKAGYNNLETTTYTLPGGSFVAIHFHFSLTLEIKTWGPGTGGKCQILTQTQTSIKDIWERHNATHGWYPVLPIEDPSGLPLKGWNLSFKKTISWPSADDTIFTGTPDKKVCCPDDSAGGNVTPGPGDKPGPTTCPATPTKEDCATKADLKIKALGDKGILPIPKDQLDKLRALLIYLCESKAFCADGIAKIRVTVENGIMYVFIGGKWYIWNPAGGGSLSPGKPSTPGGGVVFPIPKDFFANCP